MRKLDDKVRFLIIFSVVFAIVYKFSLWYASSVTHTASFSFSFEKYIPFLPWTIIPYLSSGVFFCIVFFIIPTKEKLSIFFKRVILMTVLAGIAFVAFPMHYSFAKPTIENPLLNSLFWLLNGIDDPYNQSPSLHIAYAFAFWTVFRDLKGKWKILSGFWLVMVGLSTLTTFQHHLIDIFAGSILAHLVYIIVPAQPKSAMHRNFHVANYYILFGWLTFLGAILLAENYSPYWLNVGWLSLLSFVMAYLVQKYQLNFLQRAAVRTDSSKKFFNIF